MLDSSEIKQAALDVGFDACGIARADTLTDDEYPLREWLRHGWHGDLAYMERNVDMRMDPRQLVPGAKSVICCVSSYPPPDNLPPCGRNPEIQEKVAAYARHRDYHKDIKQMLFALRERLGIDGKCCCDTVPISDKHWAARAGLGQIGRHTLLITPQWGSWVNLGEIVTTEECDAYDAPLPAEGSLALCNDCNRCVEACPNHALAPLHPSPDATECQRGTYMLNVVRCTAYYNTHHDRALPPDIDTKGYAKGCDLCQLACPRNHPEND